MINTDFALEDTNDAASTIDIDTCDFTLAIDGLIEEHRKISEKTKYTPLVRTIKAVKVSVTEPYF